MITKILLKDSNNAVIYFEGRSPVTVSSDCGNAVELVMHLIKPWPTKEEQERSKLILLKQEIAEMRANDDDKTDVINIEDLEEAV
ncbi:MAG: hypothetical protein HC840_10510 [Leptolyngbyaceae cyanobacterium RM2_2_4]|nr:hypothetical protein [Leptolyngbyaceae cyanobacterium RM2_2_4]